MAKKSKEERYTDPELREGIKEEIKRSDKGGRPGQWSARKSQLLAREYEKRGGGYKGEKSDEQKHLDDWTAQDWRTKEGSARARKGGETERYLPKEAWERMSEEEKEATDAKKREGSRKGEQYVENTSKAKREGRRAREGDPPLEGYDDLTVEGVKGKLDGLSKSAVQEILLYEKKNRNRKTVISALNSRLS